MTAELKNSSENVQRWRKMTGEDLCMSPSRAVLLNGEISEDASRGEFSISFKKQHERPNYSNIFEIFGFWQPGLGKGYCADKVFLDANEVEIKLVLIDGQTSVSQIHPGFALEMDTVDESKGTDSIGPNIIGRGIAASKFNPIFNRSYDYFSSRLDDERLGGLRFLQHAIKFDRNQSGIKNPSFGLWDDLNVLMTLGLGDAWNVYGKTSAVMADARPGVTGATIVLEGNTLYFTAIADTPVFLLLKNGVVSPLFITANSIFDKRTVLEMRKLIEKGEAKEAGEARKILLENGYFVQSYREKTNNENGGVLVCNGDSRFHHALTRLAVPVALDTRAIAAAIFMTDGPICHLQDVDNGLNSAGVENLMRHVLSGDLEYINQEEEKTFCGSWPQRERQSDDSSMVVLQFVDNAQMQKLVNYISYPF